MAVTPVHVSREARAATPDSVLYQTVIPKEAPRVPAHARISGPDRGICSPDLVIPLVEAPARALRAELRFALGDEVHRWLAALSIRRDVSRMKLTAWSDALHSGVSAERLTSRIRPLRGRRSEPPASLLRPRDCPPLPMPSLMELSNRAAFVALLFALPAAPSAHAQPPRVGSFFIREAEDPATGENRSVAAIIPRRGPGQVRWQCVERGGVAVGINLGVLSHDEYTRRVTWRFDGDPPDTTSLSGMSGTMDWYLPPDDVASFTVRARTARRLVVRALSAGTEYVYALDQPGPALDRLPCARGTPVPGQPLRPGRERDGVERATPPDEGTYELSAVEVLPRIRNRAELARLLAEGFPPALRDSGVQGTATLRFRVLENGAVDSATVQVTHSTHEAFNEPAIAAVRRLVATPAMVNGRPVKVWVELPLTFTLTRNAEAPDSAAAPPSPPP
jgi:TonB family protein